MLISIALWVIAFAVVLIPMFAYAETAITLGWTAPTKRIDGAELKPSELLGYDIQAQTPGQPWKWIKWLPASESQWAYSATAPGEYCFQIRAVDTRKIKSDYTASQCVQISSEAAPSAPELNVIKIEWVQ